MLRRAVQLLGMGFGTGLAPAAPATVGSLAAVIIYFLLPFSGDSLGLFLLIGLGFLVGVPATASLITSGDTDPHRAVWDEFVGMWASCLLLPKTWPWLLAAFVCFRVFDIIKPWPLRRLERLPGGLGIMADDLAAGILSAALLNMAHLTVF